MLARRLASISLASKVVCKLVVSSLPRSLLWSCHLSHALYFGLATSPTLSTLVLPPLPRSLLLVLPMMLGLKYLWNSALTFFNMTSPFDNMRRNLIQDASPDASLEPLQPCSAPSCPLRNKAKHNLTTHTTHQQNIPATNTNPNPNPNTNTNTNTDDNADADMASASRSKFTSETCFCCSLFTSPSSSSLPACSSSCTTYAHRNPIFLVPDDVAPELISGSPRRKRVRFVRHGCGLHNATYDYNNPAMWDAQLVDKGKFQCDVLRRDLKQQGEWLKPKLVVASSLTRALQTATRVFDLDPTQSYSTADQDTIDFPDNTDNNSDERIEKNDNGSHVTQPRNFFPRCVATELCREEISTHQCDRRRNVSVLEKEFPYFDFSHVLDEEDLLWHRNRLGLEPYTRKKLPFATWTNRPKFWMCLIENKVLVRNRTKKFLNWLAKQPEDEIAVVSHAVFLQHLFRENVADNIAALSPLHAMTLKCAWANCESRVVTLLDYSYGRPESRATEQPTGPADGPPNSNPNHDK